MNAVQRKVDISGFHHGQHIPAIAKPFVAPPQIFSSEHVTRELGEGFPSLTVFTAVDGTRDLLLVQATHAALIARHPDMPASSLSDLLVKGRHVFQYSHKTEIETLVRVVESVGISSDPSIYFFLQREDRPVKIVRIFRGKAMAGLHLSYPHPVGSNCRVSLFNFAH